MIKESIEEEEPPFIGVKDTDIESTQNLGNAFIQVNIIPPTPSGTPDSTLENSSSPLLQATVPSSPNPLASSTSMYDLQTLFDSHEVNDSEHHSAAPVPDSTVDSQHKEEECPSTPDLVFGHRQGREMSGFQTISTVTTSSSEAKTYEADSPSWSNHVDIWEDTNTDANNSRGLISDIGIAYERDGVDADRMLASSVPIQDSPALSYKSVRFSLPAIPEADLPQTESILLECNHIGVPASWRNGDELRRADDGKRQTQMGSRKSDDDDDDEEEKGAQRDEQQPVSDMQPDSILSSSPYKEVFKSHMKLRKDLRELEGSNLVLQRENSDLKNALDKQTRGVENLQRERDELKLELTNLSRRYAIAESDLVDAREQLSSSVSRVREQEVLVYIAELNKRVVEMESMIEKMKTQLGSLQVRIHLFDGFSVNSERLV